MPLVSFHIYLMFHDCWFEFQVVVEMSLGQYIQKHKVTYNSCLQRKQTGCWLFNLRTYLQLWASCNPYMEVSPLQRSLLLTQLRSMLEWYQIFLPDKHKRVMPMRGRYGHLNSLVVFLQYRRIYLPVREQWRWSGYQTLSLGFSPPLCLPCNI